MTTSNTENRRAGLGRILFSLLKDWRLIGFNLLSIIFAPFLIVRKILRCWKHGPGGEFEFHRWTCPMVIGNKILDGKSAKQHSEQGPHIIFIAPGTGRMQEQLTAAIQQVRPDVTTTWAYRSKTSQTAICNAYPDQHVTRVPFDFIFPVSLWLTKYRPDVVVLVERLRYPNIIQCAPHWNTKVILISGRPKPYKTIQGKIWKPLHRWMYGGLAATHLQSEDYLQRANAAISGESIKVSGNIKFGLRPQSKMEDILNLESWIKAGEETPLLVAGSTWEPEEEFTLKAFEIVRQQIPCRLLIAPRYLNRVAEVSEIVEKFGFRLSRRTEPAPNADVLILDTQGELATAYKFAVAAFIGGTLEKTGHDVSEPLVWGVPVSYGPGNGKMGPGQKECDAAGVGFRVTSSEELAEHWLAILRSSDLREELRHRASRLLQEQENGFIESVNAILELLPPKVT